MRPDVWGIYQHPWGCQPVNIILKLFFFQPYRLPVYYNQYSGRGDRRNDYGSLFGTFSWNDVFVTGSHTQTGYELSRVQRVDVGLSSKGYKTDKYRVVFFGKGKQIQQLSLKYPQLIPYLPLKIAIFAENDNTILISSNPTIYNDLFKLPELKPTFEIWLKDITQILKSVQIQNWQLLLILNLLKTIKNYVIWK